MPTGQQPGALGTASSGASGGSGAASNSIAIDLSTMGGLAANFYGDSDQTLTLPQRRILVNDTNTNQMAEGYFNPWLRQGYMSPSVSTLQAMTISGSSPVSVLSSSVTDPLSQRFWFAEEGKNIFMQNGSDSFTLTNEHSLVGTQSLDDLEIYELNGTRTLFYSFSQPSDTVTFNTSGHVVAGNNGNYSTGTVVQFSVVGGSLPTGISSATNYYIVNANGSATFQVSASLGGSAISFSSNGSGTITMTGVSGLGGIGVYPLVGSTFTDAWLAGVSYNGGNVVNPLQLSNARHFMRLGNDGYMYIFDGSNVHRLDGTILGGLAGTITQAVYSVPPYHLITDGVSYRQQMFIATKDSTTAASTSNTSYSNYNSYAYVIIWDMTATATETKDILTIPGILSIQKLFISPSGKLRLIGVSSNGLTKLMEYDGTEFGMIMHLGLGAAPQYPDSLTTSDTLTIWIANDGNIYGHGVVADNTTEVLAKIGNFVTPTGSPRNQINYAGALSFTGGSNGLSGISGYRIDRQGYTFSYYDGSTSPHPVRFYPFDKGTINSVAQDSLQGNIYTGVHFLESSTASFYTGTRFISQLSTIGFINLFFAAAGTGGSSVQATVRVFLNGSTTQWGSGKSITRDDIKKGYKRIEMNQPYVNTVQLKFEYPTNVVLSDGYDFHPYQALVYYSPTNTMGGKN